MYERFSRCSDEEIRAQFISACLIYTNVTYTTFRPISIFVAYKLVGAIEITKIFFKSFNFLNNKCMPKWWIVWYVTAPLYNILITLGYMFNILITLGYMFNIPWNALLTYTLLTIEINFIFCRSHDHWIDSIYLVHRPGSKYFAPAALRTNLIHIFKFIKKHHRQQK